MEKMSSEIMAYSCSPWKTDLGSTLLPLSFLNDRCFLTREISHIVVTSSFRLVGVDRPARVMRQLTSSLESILLVIYLRRFGL